MSLYSTAVVDRIQSMLFEEEDEAILSSSPMIEVDRTRFKLVQTIGNVAEWKTTDVFQGEHPEVLMRDAGAQKEAILINVYPHNHVRPRRSGQHRTWHSFNRTEIEDEQGVRLGYKYEYKLIVNGVNAGWGLKEYALHPHGQNEYSLCVIHRKRAVMGRRRGRRSTS